ncbi:glutaredoxin family protein [Ureibacillus sp. FSL K6-8385]|uniref:Glutaredoxin family protein n=1 Tax=Ureibacillus terrenus TaxID=118246 RepID=A0A540V362_9BACL|nr:glutaredoxin family protein [Ureibacillus terrenus]MED3662737.1 glutaredoxin family protein [Ureibacillus terrenus]MED3763684.1 glutaredoxin family protein [Ureibacillus terrenus]TQE91185.1 glutaredoxin family protein [Ureibacillus terrenus]
MSNAFDVIVWSKQGCSYCNEVKSYLDDKEIPYKTIDVTNRDEFREILEAKYGVRHVPVVEIGKNGTYKGVTEVGLEHLIAALEQVSRKKGLAV